MSKRVAIVAVLALTLASGAWAGMVFTSTTTAEGGKGAAAAGLEGQGLDSTATGPRSSSSRAATP